MENKKISVIVPVYNVEKYLSRCIDSVLQQTYKNFELILIDDGSTDNSSKICDIYAKADDRIKVLHKKNEGVSVARNIGIDIAQGECIFFVDSDDWVSENCLHFLTSAMERNPVQLVAGSFQYRSIKCKSHVLPETFWALNKNDNILNLSCVWNQLFLSKIIKENNLKFPLGMKYGEDTLFHREYLKHCEMIYTISDIGYYYNSLNANSASKKIYKGMTDWYLRLIDSYIDLLNYFNIRQEQVKEKVRIYIKQNFLDYVHRIVEKYQRKEAKRKIREIIKSFQIYFEQYEVRDIDVELVYKQSKKNIRKIKLKIPIKRLLSPILEKYRDGVKKLEL